METGSIQIIREEGKAPSVQALLIDGSGCYIDDPDNGLLYFIDIEAIKRNGKIVLTGGGKIPPP